MIGFKLVRCCVRRSFVLVVQVALEVVRLGTIHIHLVGCTALSDVHIEFS